MYSSQSNSGSLEFSLILVSPELHLKLSTATSPSAFRSESSSPIRLGESPQEKTDTTPRTTSSVWRRVITYPYLEDMPCSAGAFPRSSGAGTWSHLQLKRQTGHSLRQLKTSRSMSQRRVSDCTPRSGLAPAPWRDVSTVPRVG